VLEERLRGIDRATVLLNDTVTRVPTDVQLALDSRIVAVEQQKVGGREANASMYALAGFVLMLLTIAATVFALRP
jgi:hypothetical protein